MANNTRIRLLAISGSLRRASSNTALLAAAARLSPEAVEVVIYGELAQLPAFDPDLDENEPPAAVARFRAQLRSCEGVVISSPEYAHGVPGALKNALDWIVASGELIGKPVALINSSARALHAWASLRDTLRTMSAHVITAASITISLDGTTRETARITEDPKISGALRVAIGTLAFAALEARPPMAAHQSFQQGEE
jgi:NAD(P)H-dependent FMN reductase